MGKPIRILIIDDCEDDARLVVARLEQSEFSPIWKRVDAAEALRAALTAQAWDIVLSDHSMPDFGSLQALSVLQETGVDVPFVIFSGAITEEEIVAAIRAGAADYVSKEGLSRLIPVVERELRAAQARREHQQLEQIQRENQARRSAILDSAIDAIVTIDHEGRIFEWNRAAETIFGYRRSDVLGRVMADIIIPPALRASYLSGIDRYLVNGNARVIGQRSEWTALRADGTEFPVEIAVSRVPVDGPPVFTSFIRDITERKRAEEALRRTEELYRRAIAAADAVPYLREYRTETYTFMGEGIQRLTGYHAAEMTPRLWEGLVQETILRGAAAGLTLDEAVRRTRSGQIKHWQSDCRITTREGRTRWVADSSIEIPDEHGAGGKSIGILMDITDRRQLEDQLRQLQKMESIGQLAAGVAHDFNNILSVIQGHAYLLLGRMVEGKDAEESIKQVAAAAKRAAALTRQLLTFSRKQEMQPQDLNLDEVVQGMAKMIGRLVGAPITLDFTPTPGLPSLTGDVSMMEQVLLNLAVNARDAMPRGGNLSVRTAVCDVRGEAATRNPEARPGRFVRLSVTDTGSGIPPEILPRIFEPFFTTKEAGKGTGLGLATVYGIVKQHNGWIEVDSRLGHGTTFHVFLPAGSGAARPAAEPAAPAGAAARGRRETILVAEDEPALRRLAARILGNLGYEVLEAGSGVEALQVWQQHGRKIDLLLADLVMPDGLTGRELAKRIQTEDAALKVIYTSGYSPETRETTFVFREGTNFLQKPYPPSRLAEIVRRCLDGESPQ